MISKTSYSLIFKSYIFLMYEFLFLSFKVLCFYSNIKQYKTILEFRNLQMVFF